MKTFADDICFILIQTFNGQGLFDLSSKGKSLCSSHSKMLLSKVKVLSSHKRQGEEEEEGEEEEQQEEVGVCFLDRREF